MTDVMPEQQVVDLDVLVDGAEPARVVDKLDAVVRVRPHVLGGVRAGVTRSRRVETASI
jgi:hypothetical protein